MGKKELPLESVSSVYESIKAVIEEARNISYQAVNFSMVKAYWNIGRIIVEEEQRGKTRADYGKYLIKELSEKLSKNFGKGFDKTNLWNMKLFYLSFPIIDALRQQLNWTHYRLLIRIEKEEKQEDDNSTIGLILCSEKNAAMAKYTVLEDSKQIFASKYKLYIPSEEELKTELNRERELFEIEHRLGVERVDEGDD
jgi:hypothetical protein